MEEEGKQEEGTSYVPGYQSRHASVCARKSTYESHQRLCKTQERQEDWDGEVGAVKEGEVGAVKEGEVGAVKEGEVGAVKEGEEGEAKKAVPVGRRERRSLLRLHTKLRRLRADT